MLQIMLMTRQIRHYVNYVAIVVRVESAESLIIIVDTVDYHYEIVMS